MPSSISRLSCLLGEGLGCLSEAVERLAAADVDWCAGSILLVQISLHNFQYIVTWGVEH